MRSTPKRMHRAGERADAADIDALEREEAAAREQEFRRTHVVRDGWTYPVDKDPAPGEPTVDPEPGP